MGKSKGRAVKGGCAVVTGGGSGIGLGVARALARRGANLALVARRTAPLEAAAAELAGWGVHTVAIPSDLADAQQRIAAVQAVHSQLGAVDILVHCAGVLCGGPLTQLDAPDIEAATALNLAAPIDLTRLLLPDLAARRGAVVLVGSTAAVAPLPYLAVYAATKAGLNAFAATLRHETAPLGIHVLAVHPPAARTAMTAAMAARRPGWPLADPDAVGERIVQALEAGAASVLWGPGERSLALLYRWAPGLAWRLLHSRRADFARVWDQPADGP